MSSGEAARERRLLLFSVWASAGFAVFSSIWGIATGSSMIVFDGLYSFVSIGLSGLAVLALRFVRRVPTSGSRGAAKRRNLSSSSSRPRPSVRSAFMPRLEASSIC